MNKKEAFLFSRLIYNIIFFISIMEEDFDLDNILDALNVTGQWQPSPMPMLSDPTLNSQILDDILLSPDASEHRNSSDNDDISNALIGTSIDIFGSLSSSGNSFETDNIATLISSDIGEIPIQSTIEDTMERMNINHAQTNILSSSISIQMGSSPVEQKVIDNSILARKLVRDQQRIYKTASKSRKSSGKSIVFLL
jgi:hypothetical protein